MIGRMIDERQDARRFWVRSTGFSRNLPPKGGTTNENTTVILGRIRLFSQIPDGQRRGNLLKLPQSFPERMQ